MIDKPETGSEPTAVISAPVMFDRGEEVKIAKKSRLVDVARAHEDLTPEARVPIDMDVTGVQGRICGTPYHSTSKDGEVCVPIELGDGNVLGIPASRLERTSRTPRTDASESIRQTGKSSVSMETMEFWEKHFKEKAKLEIENERLREENAKLRNED
jgi:hypothetical protein